MDQKTLDLIKQFMENLDVEGICGFWVDYDEEDILQDIWVYIILDLDWLEEIPTKRDFVAKRMRLGIRDEIKKWLDLDVKVGSISKKCD